MRTSQEPTAMTHGHSIFPDTKSRSIPHTPKALSDRYKEIDAAVFCLEMLYKAEPAITLKEEIERLQDYRSQLADLAKWARDSQK